MNFGSRWAPMADRQKCGETKEAGWHPWVLLDPPGPRLADPPGVPGGLQAEWGDEHEQLHMHLSPKQSCTG